MTEIIKRTIRGGVYFLTSNLLNKILGFVFVLISSRILGPVEFGVFSLGLSVSGIAMNIGALGLPTTIQRFLSGGGEGERAEKMYGGILVIFPLVSLISGFVLFYFSSSISVKIFSEPKLAIVLKVFGVGVIINIGFRICKALLTAQEKVKKILVGTFAQSAFKIVFLLIIFLWVENAFSAALATEMAMLFALFYLISCVCKLDIKPAVPSKEDFKRVIAYSLPLVFVGFSYFLAQQTDRIMLGWLSTSSDVGVYTVSSTLALLMSTLHASLVSIFMPLASKAYRSQNYKELNEAYLFISKWVGSINGIIALVFAGAGLTILNIFGSIYSTEVTYQLLLLLATMYFFGTWVGPTGALLQMADGHKIEMYNTAIYIILNIVLNYIFIIKFGLIGAAWGTLLSSVIRNILQVAEIKYYYGLEIINKTGLILLILVLSGILGCYLFQPYKITIALIFLASVFYFIFKNINEQENKLLKKLLNKHV